MELEGVIEEPQFLRYLVEMGRDRFTGAVRLEREDLIKILYLQEGRIISASTNDPAEGVDELLLRGKKVSREHVQQARSKRKMDETLGDALLSSGFISRKELRWARRHQIVSVLRSALGAEGWHYTVVPDYVSSRSSEGTHFDVEPLLIELVVTDPDRRRIDRRLEGGEVKLRKVPSFDEKYSRLGLNEDADRVAKLVDGKRSAAEIAAEAGGNSFMNLKLLAALHVLGVVETKPKAQGQLEISFRGGAGEGSLLPGIAPGRGEPASADEPPAPVVNVPSWELESFPESEPSLLDASGDRDSQRDSPAGLDDELATGDEVKRAVSGERDDDVAARPDDQRAIEAGEGSVGGELPMAFSADTAKESSEPFDVDLSWDEETVDRETEGEDVFLTDVGAQAVPPGNRSRRGRYLLAAALLAGLLVLGLFLWPLLERDGVGQPALVDEADLPVDAAPGTTTITPAGRPDEPVALIEEETPAGEEQAAEEVETAGEPQSEQTADGVESLRDRHDQMAREYASGADAVPYTLQFEIVCETSSVTLALQHGGSSVWFVPIEYQGRPCYRVFWGRYPDEQSAAAAADQIPQELRGSRPVVVRPGRVVQ